MKASIIIRTFNSGQTIKRVLEEVLAQASEGCELVVVDSGSTDETLKIVREHPHTFVDYSGEKFTYGGTLNAGCAASRGEYLVCLSSHCIPLRRDWLRRLVEVMDRDEKLAGAWGPLLFEAKNGATFGQGVELVDLKEFCRRPNRGLQNPNSIIRRSLWEQRPFSEEVERCEDQEWAHHFLQRGYRTAVVRDAEALYEIPYGPLRYGRKTMRDFIVLHEMFGYRSDITTAELFRRSSRLFGAAVLGKKSLRVSILVFSGLIGAWIADKVVWYKGVVGRQTSDCRFDGQ